MSIYTKKGDQGETSLLGGIRVPKDSLRIDVYGTLDEVTSALGLARATTQSRDLAEVIYDLQGEFIDIMGELASDPVQEPKPNASGKAFVYRTEAHHVERLEKLIDQFQSECLPQHEFVRPGGSPASAALDMARTFVRRAERRLIALGRQEAVNPNLFRYFNRLSDLFHTMARLDEQRTMKQMVRDALKQAGVGDKQGQAMKTLNLEDCDRLISAGMKRAEAIGIPMVLSVVDAFGQLIAFKRMDNALGVSVTLSPNKAYSAAVLRMETKELDNLARCDGPLAGIDANMPKLTRIGGGIPLMCQGILLGAVGVSGGSVEQDVDVARTMVEAL